MKIQIGLKCTILVYALVYFNTLMGNNKMDSISSVSELPESFSQSQLLRLHDLDSMPSDAVQSLLPIKNMTVYINRYRNIDCMSYFANCMIENQNGKFLIYIIDSSDEINVMLADISKDDYPPKTLVLQRYYKTDLTVPRIFYSYDTVSNIIEINTISRFADYPYILYKESYLLLPDFPRICGQLFEYIEDSDTSKIKIPFDEMQWREISPDSFS